MMYSLFLLFCVALIAVPICRHLPVGSEASVMALIGALTLATVSLLERSSRRRAERECYDRERELFQVRLSANESWRKPTLVPAHPGQALEEPEPGIPRALVEQLIWLHNGRVDPHAGPTFRTPPA